MPQPSNCLYKAQLQDKNSQFLPRLLEKTRDLSPIFNAQAQPCSSTRLGNQNKQSEGKMSFLTIASCLLVLVYDCSAVDIMPELKKNILNFWLWSKFQI